MARRVQIAVVGGSPCTAEVAGWAHEIGKRVARAGGVLICGGLSGVMEAAARGAHEEGGLTVGILPSYDPATANPWIDVAIPTGMGHARNMLVAAAADALIALPGQHGTASEISLAGTIRRPVIALGAWSHVPEVVVAHSPAEAVEAALSRARSVR